MNERKIVTRFAPSPTGDLHLGGALVALASWWMAKKNRGRFLVRMEDIDTPRVVKGAAAKILEDMHWLGLAWDGEVAMQSARTDLYRAALAKLEAASMIYMCDCSRADLARVASAPHANEEAVYPGICSRLGPTREMKRAPALRVRIPHGTEGSVTFEDEIQGKYTQSIRENVGDFVVQRADGVFAYQLAVIVDDTAQGVTHVVRGVDLLSSTPRQIFLSRALGQTPPRYMHLPLVVDERGERIAKRTPGAHVRTLRDGGVSREEILGELAYALGLSKKRSALDPSEIAELDAPTSWPHASWTPPERWTSCNLA